MRSGVTTPETMVPVGIDLSIRDRRRADIRPDAKTGGVNGRGSVPAPLVDLPGMSAMPDERIPRRAGYLPRIRRFGTRRPVGVRRSPPVVVRVVGCLVVPPVGIV